MNIDVFRVHGRIMTDYRSFVSSFLNIRDDRIRQTVEAETKDGRFWPDPFRRAEAALGHPRKHGPVVSEADRGKEGKEDLHRGRISF